MIENRTESVKALQDIRDMMERSAKFISLSGWSGVWAGCVGLAGAAIARSWLKELPEAYYNIYRRPPHGIMSAAEFNAVALKFVILAITVLLIALAGGYFFTMRKAKKNGTKLWNSATRRMLTHMAIPLFAGGMFSLLFLLNNHELYIAPACLVFYGLALINGSKYTLTDIRYLGFSELALGFMNMFLPGYGLTFWALGFGVLHILYGIVMWNKYDNNKRRQAEE